MASSARLSDETLLALLKQKLEVNLFMGHVPYLFVLVTLRHCIACQADGIPETVDVKVNRSQIFLGGRIPISSGSLLNLSVEEFAVQNNITAKTDLDELS